MICLTETPVCGRFRVLLMLLCAAVTTWVFDDSLAFLVSAATMPSVMLTRLAFSTYATSALLISASMRWVICGMERCLLCGTFVTCESSVQYSGHCKQQQLESYKCLIGFSWLLLCGWTTATLIKLAFLGREGGRKVVWKSFLPFFFFSVGHWIVVLCFNTALVASYAVEIVSLAVLITI